MKRITSNLYKGIAVANMLAVIVGCTTSANAATNMIRTKNPDLAKQSFNVMRANARTTGSEEQQLLQSAFDKFAKGDYKGAIEDFTKVLAINPKNEDALANRALSHLYDGNPLDGLVDAEQAANIAPDWFFPKFVKGLCYEGLQQFENAVDQFTQALSQNKNDKTIYLHRGFSQFSLKKYDESISDLSKALLLNPNWYYAHWYRCWAYMGKGDLKMAKADADKLVSLEPNNGDTQRILGNVYELMGEKDNAIAAYKKSADQFMASGNTKMAKVVLDAANRLEAAA